MPYISFKKKGYADSSPTGQFPDWTVPRLTLPRTDISPNGQFPDRTLPRLDISPLGHFPDRTFPRPYISLTTCFSDIYVKRELILA